MTVKELKKLLEKYDDTIIVHISFDSDFGSNPAQRLFLEKNKATNKDNLFISEDE